MRLQAVVKRLRLSSAVEVAASTHDLSLRPGLSPQSPPTRPSAAAASSLSPTLQLKLDYSVTCHHRCIMRTGYRTGNVAVCHFFPVASQGTVAKKSHEPKSHFLGSWRCCVLARSNCLRPNMSGSNVLKNRSDWPELQRHDGK